MKWLKINHLKQEGSIKLYIYYLFTLLFYWSDENMIYQMQTFYILDYKITFSNIMSVYGPN